MSTPAKPISSAAQRENEARSFSQTIETRAANSGAEKLIETAPGERHERECKREQRLRDRLRQAASKMIARTSA